MEPSDFDRRVSERARRLWRDWVGTRNQLAVKIGLAFVVFAMPIAILIERAEAPPDLAREFTVIRLAYLVVTLAAGLWALRTPDERNWRVMGVAFFLFAGMQLMTTWVSVRWAGLRSPMFADFTLTMMLVTFLFIWPKQLVAIGYSALGLAFVGAHVALRPTDELVAGAYPLFFVITSTGFAIILHHFLHQGMRESIAAQAEVDILKDQAEAYAEELFALSSELDRLAHIDGLTHVANRRALENALSEYDTSPEPLTVMMIDVDFFKRYNDACGHQAGDRCLQRVAAELEASMRGPQDLVARYGGEEFVVLLRGAGNGLAAEIANRLRTRIEELGIPHPDSDIADVVTISVGAVVDEDGGSEANLVEQADAALYRAKQSGRNSVVFAEP